MKTISSYALGMLLVLLCTNSFATSLTGKVYCDAQPNGIIDSGDTPLENVLVNLKLYPSLDHLWGNTTDANGYYFLSIPEDPVTLAAMLDPSTLPDDATVVIAPGNQAIFSSTDNGGEPVVDWLIDSETCQTPEGLCWMTGGGIKFDSIVGSGTARLKPKHSIGGVVHPSCSSEPSAGGQWNHVDRSQQEHFQIFDIQQVSCGNVDDHPPGSESPVTGFNYIEWVGTGRMKGIQGNKTEEESVIFFGRAEDRNEPGNESATEGTDIDRYFLRAWKIGGGGEEIELLCVDDDDDCSTVDPITITGGNLQLHESSCD